MQAKVTTKGQITLPKAVRDHLSIQSSDRIEFSVEDDHTVSIQKMGAIGSSAGCAKQFLTSNQKRFTRVEEKAAMVVEVAAKYAPKQ